MEITVLSVSISTTPTAKGSYQSAEVAYKSADGQIKGKKLMSFGDNGPAFKILSKAQAGEVYEVTPVKNAKDFWDWVDVKKLDGSSMNTTPSIPTETLGRAAPAGKVVGSNYPTADERADTQRYIVRQSSVANAVNLRKDGTQDPAEIIATAKEFEAYVFGKECPVVVATKSFDDFESDVPL